ncbi:MAG: hypothetical protein NVS9B14_23280 [Candidatus Acidiferrum sp.]
MSLSKKACRIFARRAFFFLLLALPRFAYSQEQQTPTIRVEVSRVNVGVIATDSHGKFIEGLTQSDFHVFDNGIEQPIAGFLANDDPAQVVLMLECGPSVLLSGAQYIQKADALIASLAPRDRIAIICYSSNPEVQFEWSEDKAAARMALRSINFMQGMADLSLSKNLLAVLTRLESLEGKKTIVLLSSGADSAPPVVPEEFRARISSIDVRVLAMSTTRILVQPPKHHKRSREEKARLATMDPLLQAGEATLRDITSATGGRIYFPLSPKDFDKTFYEIAQIVRHEYNLAFVPQSFDGKLHSLSVTANHAARLDHRQAYLAPLSQ